MSLIESLLGGRTSPTRGREELLDVLLMAALADGDLGQRDLDRLARLLEEKAELAGLTWDDVVRRARELEGEAPAFERTRARVVAVLGATDGRAALALASQLLGAPLSEEEHALLVGLADDLGIEAEERDSALSPWSDLDPLGVGYVRCSFNNPDVRRDESIFDAMAHAENTLELGLLTSKLAAIRAVMSSLSERAVLSSLGELVDIGGGVFRVDALIEADGHSFIMRALAPGEAMYPKELALLPDLVAALEPSVSLLVACSKGLPLPDAAALAKLDPARVRVERVAI